MKTEMLSVVGMKINSRFGSKAGFCQFVAPSIPGLMVPSFGRYLGNIRQDRPSRRGETLGPT